MVYDIEHLLEFCKRAHIPYDRYIDRDIIPKSVTVDTYIVDRLYLPCIDEALFLMKYHRPDIVIAYRDILDITDDNLLSYIPEHNPFDSLIPLLESNIYPSCHFTKYSWLGLTYKMISQLKKGKVRICNIKTQEPSSYTEFMYSLFQHASHYSDAYPHEYFMNHPIYGRYALEDPTASEWHYNILNT